MQRRYRDPTREFSRAMDESEYPVTGIDDGDSPLMLRGVARVHEYIDRLERDTRLGRHLLSPDRYWHHGPIRSGYSGF